MTAAMGACCKAAGVDATMTRRLSIAGWTHRLVGLATSQPGNPCPRGGTGRPLWGRLRALRSPTDWGLAHPMTSMMLATASSGWGAPSP